MEALVNIAYDRISEDIILLYDAMRAYNEVCIIHSSWCLSVYSVFLCVL